MNKHIFSIFIENLDINLSNINSIFEIKNETIFHRIKNILRLEKSENIIFFDKNIKIETEILEYKKKSILINIKKSEKIERINPKLYSFVPILKQDPLEDVFYNLGMLGINEIFLVETELSHKRQITEKDFERLNKSIISGIEQGKLFFYPNLNKKIINLNEMINFIEKMNFNESFFWLNENSDSLNKNISKIENLSNKAFFVGPEAGLRNNEKNKLKKFKSFSIGSSILKASDCIKFISILFRAL
jgi:RsmE family RNA methyltransferase